VISLEGFGLKTKNPPLIMAGFLNIKFELKTAILAAVLSPGCG
jgi:hypothetical protein